MTGTDERTALAVAPAPLALPAVIVVSGAQAKPARFRLEKGSCVVGAGAQADIIVVDPEVSRQHVELSLAPEGVHVADLGSRNGTFYLGHRVERMTLALGSCWPRWKGIPPMAGRKSHSNSSLPSTFGL